jgi:opacity protein-like surface antigen
MKRILLVALALVFLAGAVQAAEVNTKAGTKNLVFQFSGLSNLGLGNYDTGFGMRYYLSDDMALVPALKLGFSSTKTKSGVTGYSDDKTTGMRFGVDLALEKHTKAIGAISPCIGAGVGFVAASSKHEPSRLSSPPTGTTLKVTDKSMGFGVFGLCGFEWAWTSGLTLGGEYRLGLQMDSGKRETELQGTNTQTSDDTSGFGLGIGTASVFLSVEF